jgi:hypothetical protein
MVVKVIERFFEEYEKKRSISNFANKFDYNLLKAGTKFIFIKK